MIFSLLSKFAQRTQKYARFDFFFFFFFFVENQSKGYGCICLDLSLDLLSIFKISG